MQRSIQYRRNNSTSATCGTIKPSNIFRLLVNKKKILAIFGKLFRLIVNCAEWECFCSARVHFLYFNFVNRNEGWLTRGIYSYWLGYAVHCIRQRWKHRALLKREYLRRVSISVTRMFKNARKNLPLFSLFFFLFFSLFFCVAPSSPVEFISVLCTRASRER